MSWKTQIQLLDYDSDVRLEARCSGCGYTWHEEPCLYFLKSHLRQLFVDDFDSQAAVQAMELQRPHQAIPNK